MPAGGGAVIALRAVGVRREGTVVLDGDDLTDVLRADGGFVPWLWSRWSFLSKAGLTRAEFEDVVIGYRREIWLWLAGERIWTQCCSGLVGRVSRRMAQVDNPSD